MKLHERAILCCQLADEEEKLDELIKEELRWVVLHRERMSRLIDKRDALIMVRHHILSCGRG